VHGSNVGRPDVLPDAVSNQERRQIYIVGWTTGGASKGRSGGGAWQRGQKVKLRETENFLVLVHPWEWTN